MSFIFKKTEYRLMHYEPDSDASINGRSSNTDQFREDFEVEVIDVASAKAFRQYGGIQVVFILLKNNFFKI